MNNASQFDYRIPIYIDVSLGNDIKGQDVASEVHTLGFANIYISTGYDPDTIEVPPCVLSVVGKDFPL